MKTATTKLIGAACLGACVTSTAPIVWDHVKPHHKTHHVSTHHANVSKQPICPASDFVTPALRPMDGPEPMTWAAEQPDWPVGVTRPHPAPEPSTFWLIGTGAFWIGVNYWLWVGSRRK